MTNSNKRRAPFLVDVDAPKGAYRDVVLAVEYRKRMIGQIVKHARSQGLDADSDMVNKHYPWFLRWYEGVLATGYLMNRTGVKRIGVRKWQA